MAIAVRCANIVRFDPQQGKYIHCDHKFAVKDELAGRSVRCPKCGEAVQVAEAPAAQAEAPAKPVEPAAKPPSPAAEKADYSDVLDDEFRLEDPVEKPAAALPVESSPAAKPQAPAPEPEVAREAAVEEKAPCPGCGRPLSVQSMICTSCGYHKALQRRVDEFVEEDEGPLTTGFERWLRRQLVAGDDPGALRSVMIVVGLLLLAGGACLFLIIGHLIWILVAAAGIVAAGAWMGWWRLDPWQALLFVNRTIGWRTPAPPFARRQVLDLRDMGLNDEELANLQNLADFDVIDLEGTPITDQGLHALYDHRNLRYIVLRDTQTSEEGVAGLQRALPKASIWR